MTSLFALFGHGVMLMAVILMLLQVRRWKQYWPLAYLISAVVIILPLQNWLVIEFSWGYFSDLSMATVFVCLCYVATGMRLERIKMDQSLKLTILILAAILFPSAMGATNYDMFSLGFPSEAGFNYLLIVITVIGLLAWYKQAKHLSIYIGMVLISYGLGLYESHNLWLYIIDPIVVIIFAISYLIALVKLLYSMLKNRLLNHV